MTGDKLMVREVFNLALLSLAAAMIGFQVLIIIGVAYSFIPLNTGLSNLVLVEWRESFFPSRNLFFYRIFACIVLILQGTAFLIFSKRIKTSAFVESLKKFIAVESAVVILPALALFQIYYYDDLSRGKYLLGCGIFLMIVTKFFRLQIFSLIDRWVSFFSSEKSIDTLARYTDYLFPAFVFLVVYIPDRTMAIARILQYDNLYHFDGVVMGAAWASLKGCIFNIDVFSQYGIGMPIVIGRLSQLLGGFSYENVFAVLNVLSIVCLIGIYLFLRLWLKDAFLAMAGVLVLIIFRLYAQSRPFIWAYPNGIIASRYLFEAAFFILLLLCIRKPHLWLRAALAFMLGFSLFYVLDTSLYLLATYYCYLGISFLKDKYGPTENIKKQRAMGWIAYFISPLIVAFLFLWAVTGSAIFKDAFWKNGFEFSELFLSGLGSTPMSSYLKQRDFLGIFLAVAMLLEYFLTIAVVGRLCFTLKIKWENILAVLISIYGLCLFNHFICRPGTAYYRAAGFPFILVTCYWISKLIGLSSHSFKRRMTVVLAALAFLTLITCRSFIEYPHVFHVPSEEDAALIGKDIKENLPPAADIALIDKLTAPGEKVCLVSDFETMILMEADRPPFLYYFPMVHSTPKKSNRFGGIYLMTKKQAQRTLERFEQIRPTFVFIDRKLINELPPVYYVQERTFSLLLLYLSKNYDRFSEGKDLVVLRRKK